MFTIRCAGVLLMLAGAATASLQRLDGDIHPVAGRAVAVYKSTPQGELKIHLYFPPDWKAADRRPAFVLFFGGGFVTGSPSQFTTTAEYFSRRGLVAASAEYRIGNVHHTPPARCAEDARSAIRWLRMNARHLGIDAGRVLAGGGSAGGTIAAFAAYNTAYEPEGEDASVSAKPDALVLYNPALGFDELDRVPPDQRKTAEGPIGIFIRNWTVTKGGPPAILFYGTEDALEAGGRRFVRNLLAAGTRAELYTAAGQGHGFFNDRPGSPWHALVVRQSDFFLKSLGYVNGEPAVQPLDSSTAALEKALP
ncbi:MAG TPA: alpha/beta hydrolase [Bryobacteraceae bacterium]|nr:alpha/beta hydrolase [Bryobacteraceae bacterium]